MNLQLKGKRALATGNTSNIGEKITQVVAPERVIAVIYGRNEVRAK